MTSLGPVPLVRIKDFETDCLNFLNCFNHGLGDNQLVFTLPALTYQVEKQQMFKPPDNKYRQFWVDFNLTPDSISIFHVKEEKSTYLWDLLTITQEMVTFSITTLAGSTVLALPTTKAVLMFLVLLKSCFLSTAIYLKLSQLPSLKLSSTACQGVLRQEGECPWQLCQSRWTAR